MFKKSLLFVLLGLVQISAATQDNTSQLVKSETTFCFSLYEKINPSNENFVFSPYSIFSGTSMLSLGARGETATQINSALHVNLKLNSLAKAHARLTEMLMPSSKGYEMRFANGLWIENEAFILADYRRMLEDDFQASLQTLDFGQTEEAVKTINEWISLNTQGLIPALLQANDLDANTKAVLTNAIYFKGQWARPFNPAQTKKMPFHEESTVTESVKMMNQTAFFPYFENEQFQALEMPFVGKAKTNGQLACLILLPKPEVKLADLEKTLSTTSFQQWIDQLKSQHIHVNLPTFNISSRLPLNDVLKSMGITKAFSKEANFSGINGLKNLQLSNAIHEAIFALDEAGVTAAASTAMALKPTSMPPQEPPIEFIADHPFLFFIVELNTKTPLFMGKLQKPT
jgi:serpin B